MNNNYYTVEQAKNKDCRQAFRVSATNDFSFPSCDPEECMHWQWGEHVHYVPVPGNTSPQMPYCSGEKCVAGCLANKGYCGLSKKG